MTTKKLRTQITFTPYTIDTYGVFDMCEYEDEEISEETHRITYNHKEYVQALADNWLMLMRANILDAVIQDVVLVGEAYSPAYYNFTTDNCQVCFTVDYDALVQYVQAHEEKYRKEHIRSYDGFMWMGDEDDTMLHWYLSTVSAARYENEEYLQDQYDGVPVHEYIEYEARAIIPSDQK